MARLSDYCIRFDNSSMETHNDLLDFCRPFGEISNLNDEYFRLTTKPEFYCTLLSACQPILIQWYTLTKPYRLYRDVNWNSIFEDLILFGTSSSDINPDVYLHIYTIESEMVKLNISTPVIINR